MVTIRLTIRVWSLGFIRITIRVAATLTIRLWSKRFRGLGFRVYKGYYKG